MTDKDTLLQQLKTYLDAHQQEQTAIKQELDQLFPALASGSQLNQTSDLADAISKLKVSQSTKMPKFQKGDNFSRFCERFQEYVYIAKINDANLYMYFLQNVDDETYSILKSVNLDAAQKTDPTLFCPLFKNAVYGDITISLKNEVMECKQKSDENVADYAYRLREMANIAYTNPDFAEENCFIAFLRGIKDPQLKRKLNEATSLTNFKDAVKLAKRLERIDNMLGEDEPEISSILKESTVSFNEQSKSRSQSPQSAHDNRSRDSPPTTRSRRDSYEYKRDYRPRDDYRSNSSSRSYSSDNYRRNRSQSPYRPQSPYNNRRDSNRRGRAPTPIPRGNRYRDNYRNDIVCWNCNKKGHVKRNCWSNSTQNYSRRPNQYYNDSLRHIQNDFRRNFGQNTPADGSVRNQEVNNSNNWSNNRSNVPTSDNRDDLN